MVAIGEKPSNLIMKSSKKEQLFEFRDLYVISPTIEDAEVTINKYIQKRSSVIRFLKYDIEGETGRYAENGKKSIESNVRFIKKLAENLKESILVRREQ